MNIEKYKEYSPVVLRISLSLVFLWFGLSQIFNPDMFLGYLPDWAVDYAGMMHMRFAIIPDSTYFLLFLNGTMETALGTFLLLGVFTRLSSLFLGVHLFFIMLSLGYNDVAVRDFGLALATFSIFLHGADKWCLDKKIKNK